MSTLCRRNGQVQLSTIGALSVASGYSVTVLPVGAQVSGTPSGHIIPVRAGHGFAAGDKFMLSDGTRYSGNDSVQSVTATTISMIVPSTGSTAGLVAGNILINLGPDTGVAAPNYKYSPVAIYSDMDGTTPVGGTVGSTGWSTVTTGSDGEYGYWCGARMVWELVRNSSGTVVDYIIDPLSGGGSIQLAVGDTISFEGSTDDAYETTITVVDPTADRTVTIPNISGTLLVGPATTVDHAIARWDGAVGAALQSYTSGAPTVGDTGAVVIPLTLNVTGAITGGTLAVTGTSTLTGIATMHATMNSIVTLDGAVVVLDGNIVTLS
jgi:hypothetical protein